MFENWQKIVWKVIFFSVSPNLLPKIAVIWNEVRYTNWNILKDIFLPFFFFLTFRPNTARLGKISFLIFLGIFSIQNDVPKSQSSPFGIFHTLFFNSIIQIKSRNCLWSPYLSHCLFTSPEFFFFFFFQSKMEKLVFFILKI